MLRALPALSLLVHTGEGGAVARAGAWAAAHRVPVLVVPFVPSWSKDPAALQLRSLRLLTVPRPDVVVVFPATPSTRLAVADLVTRAQAFAIPCLFAEAL